MSKPPTSERGRRVAVAPPPPAPPRRSFFGRSTREVKSALPPREPPARAAAPDAVAATEHAALGWRPIAVLALCLLGLADSIYVTLVHYTSVVPLSCPDNGGIDCAKVITSPQSVIFGIPVAVYGLAYYLVMTAGALPIVWRRQGVLVARARLAAAVVGVGFAAYLLYTELYVLHAICLWCTGVHIVTLLIFVVLATGWDEVGAPGPDNAAFADATFDDEEGDGAAEDDDDPLS